ncbi:TonB-dependent hemoglobin/transferrin/lactoferrin family receptor [Edwardsiella hoshinae]|uniref:Heme/hemopexin utilization protein C n=1 Tax=Edwardsiella hoshinae TaxID=93378 RepID=A0A376DF33_9GAMM|nr:TonB-dependent hemoglobin/transferrin/lactoferrin family receptor [Edwardsiella hoshinae]QPR27150.1 TonB-dependent hemoglobin/transferrin/lactoferrin family receptor [Edwardsiella hoshinae]STC88342.1 Heme/hemopexin utilization protein C precursor [Edwardsiella hoshinae]
MPPLFKSQRTPLTLAIASALLLPATLHAAESHNDTMTVIATGNQRDSFSAPMMVSVIDSHDPVASSTASAPEMLRGVPGLALSGVGRSNGQDITLRGYDNRGVLVLVDGVRQGNNSGHLNGTFLDPALIKRVEVVRGPGALLYGSGALGGVIAYQTVEAADLLLPGKSSGYRLFASGGSQDSSLGIGASAYAKSDTVDGLLSFSTRQRGDLRLGADQRAANREVIGDLLAKGSWQIDDAQSLRASLRYYDNAAREPKNPQEISASANNVMTERDTRQRDAQLEYRLRPGEQTWLDVSLRPYYSDVSITASPEGERYESRTQRTIGLRLENRSRLLSDSSAAHLLTYGGETYSQSQKPGGNASSYPQADIRFASGWLQDEITLRDLPVSLVAGARYDSYRAHNDQYGDINADKWSSRAALTVTPTDWLMLFASYAQAFRAPTIGEMYNDAIHFRAGPFTNYWRPNPNLRPESNATQEAGFGLRFDDLVSEGDTLQFKSSYFGTRAKDYIDTDVNPLQFYSTSINVSDVKLWGWDMSLDYQSDAFSWQSAYNRTRGKNSRTGAWIANGTPDTVTNRLDVPLAHTGFSVGWIGTFAAPFHHYGPRSKPQAGYGVNDLYLSYRGAVTGGAFSATAVLSNALDKTYYAPNGALQDGRGARLLLSYQW